MDGLVSEEVFQAVQRILNSRAKREREVRAKNAPKYLFNGFLYCGVCDSPMYSHTNQKDSHYYCKLNGTRARKRNPESECPTPYIRASVIETKIEELLSVRLQDESFLNRIAEAYVESQEMPVGVSDGTAVRRQIETLTAKRGRILEAFFDGTIDRMQRDEQLARVDAELKVYQGVVAKPPTTRASVTKDELGDLVSAFVEMPFLQREDKRSLLSGLGVEVFVRGYKICTLAMKNVRAYCCDTDNRSRMEPSASPVPPCR
jgi:hypothetical protein